MTAFPRIVSLLPGGTEIICALGVSDWLVGRSHECDFPAKIDNRPVCSFPRLHVNGTSQGIDEGVRGIVRRGLSIYEVREDVLKSLRPDFIITQTQCEVCAVSEKDVEQAICDWTGRRPEIISLRPSLLEDVWSDIQRVADALEIPREGRRLVDSLRSRMRAVADQAVSVQNKPTVATIEWIDPLMSAGNWMPQLIAMAGGENLFGEQGDHSPWMEWSSLCAADPYLVLIIPCGFDLGRTLEESRTLENLDGWRELRAVKAGRCYAADGHHYFNRPGPRLAESLEIVAEILHPAHFDFGHHEDCWRSLATR